MRQYIYIEPIMRREEGVKSGCQGASTLISGIYMLSGSIVAIATNSTIMPTTGQSAACAVVHPVVFASLIAVIAPGIVAANTYAPRQIPTMEPTARPIGIFGYQLPHTIIDFYIYKCLEKRLIFPGRVIPGKSPTHGM